MTTKGSSLTKALRRGWHGQAERMTLSDIGKVDLVQPVDLFKQLFLAAFFQLVLELKA